MKFKLIYPKWPKLARQTEFHLPPHGPVVFAASLPEDVEVSFIDENLEPVDFDDPVDFVGISMMLTVQVKRGWEIADTYRRQGVKVIFGGIAAMLHAAETMKHADAVFIGEAEGKMDQILADVEYRSYLDDGSEEGRDRWENVLELRRLAAEYSDRDLTAFLEDVALVSDQDTLDATADAPTMLTLHAAKGLEFPVVFIVATQYLQICLRQLLALLCILQPSQKFQFCKAL